MIHTDCNKGKTLERLSRHLGLYEKDNQQKPTTEKAPDRWVVLPTDLELKLLECTQQVEEVNRWKLKRGNLL